MLKRGRNSYVTLLEAERYISLRYSGHDPLRLSWDAIARHEDKDRHLLRACEMIDAIPFPRRKTDARQALAWPRGGLPGVPSGIRHAQIELALWGASEASAGATGEVNRAELIAQGVTSFRIGDLSESLDGSRVAQGAMQCPAAALLLRPFMGGGYAMC